MEDTSKPSTKKSYFVNKTTQTSQATSNTYNSNFNTDTQLWSEAIIIEKEDIGMLRGKRQSIVDIDKKQAKGKSREE